MSGPSGSPVTGSGSGGSGWPERAGAAAAPEPQGHAPARYLGPSHVQRARPTASRPSRSRAHQRRRRASRPGAVRSVRIGLGTVSSIKDGTVLPASVPLEGYGQEAPPPQARGYDDSPRARRLGQPALRDRRRRPLLSLSGLFSPTGRHALLARGARLFCGGKRGTRGVSSRGCHVRRHRRGERGFRPAAGG